MKGVKVIIDDILIFGEGDDIKSATIDHDNNLLRLLTRLRKLNIKLNPDKIKFKAEKVSYIGHTLTNNGI